MQHIFSTGCFFFALLLVLFTFTAYAQPLIVADRQPEIKLGGNTMLYLEDAAHQLSIEQVIHTPNLPFKVSSSVFNSFGLTLSAYWFKSRLVNPESRDFLLTVDHPLLDTSEVYVVARDRIIFRKDITIRNLEMRVPNLAFRLPALPRDTLTVYFRVAAVTPVIFPVSLVAEDHFVPYILRKYTPDLLLFGAIIMMALYHLFIGYSTRDRAYLYYFGYAMSSIVVFVYARGHTIFLLGEYHYLINDYLYVYDFLVSVLLLLFALTFLQLRRQAPRMYRIAVGFIGVHGVSVSLSVLGYHHISTPFYLVTDSLGNIFILCAALYLWFGDYEPARFFIVAFSVYLVTITLIALSYADVVPFTESSVYMAHAGTFTHMLLFSVALANKINILRKEKASAQHEIIQLINIQNEMLEEKVRERTLQLQEANEELNAAFNTVDQQREDIAHKNEHIISSITYARRIQFALLPIEEEIRRVLPQSFVFYQPKDIVSGDFYWFSAQDDYLFLACADCTGHGVPGAFMTMIGNTLLNQIVNENHIYSPSRILTELDMRLLLTLHQQSLDEKIEDGMDISILRVHKATQQVVWASAKRPMIRFIAAGNEWAEIKGSRFPIGGSFFDEKEFEEHVFTCQPGDTFYLFSDGYTDQFGGEAGKKFMIKRFRELLQSIQHEDMEVQKERLNAALYEWKGDQFQTDDVLVMGVRWENE